MKPMPRHLLIALGVLFLTAQPIQALTIVVANDGAMTFSQGQVLGDEDNEGSKQETKPEEEKAAEESTQKNETSRELEKKQLEQEREQAKQTQERTREREKTAAEKRVEQNKQLKVVKSNEKKQLRVKTEQPTTEVLIEKKRSAAENDREQSEHIVEQEKIETENLQLSFPAQVDLEDNDQPETENEVENEQNDDRLQQVRQDRSKRTDKIEIKRQINDDGTPETEIETGAIKAKFKAAEFTVDPTTNNVLISTPTGETHTLLHLPDQALLQMEQAGLLDSADPLAQSELSLETQTDGSVIYKTKVKRTRRVFGLVPITVEQEVTLNDDDGTTTSTPADAAFIQKLLVSLSN